MYLTDYREYTLRYEDASLSYTGINRHAGEKVGLYDTVLSAEEYAEMK